MLGQFLPVFSRSTKNFGDSTRGATLRKKKRKEEPRVIDGKINKFR